MRGKMGIKRTKIPLIWSLWNFTGACGGDVIPPGFINKPLFHVKTGKKGIRAKRGSRQRGDPGKVPGLGMLQPFPAWKTGEKSEGSLHFCWY